MGHAEMEMKMGTMISRTVGFVLLLLAMPLTATATDLRGKVEGQNRYSPNPFPMRGPVELMDASGQRVVKASYAGADGMYYFSNVSPGNYVIRVKERKFSVTVYANSQQDVAPVRLQL